LLCLLAQLLERQLARRPDPAREGGRDGLADA
jgi:hypothetical protein